MQILYIYILNINVNLKFDRGVRALEQLAAALGPQAWAT